MSEKKIETPTPEVVTSLSPTAQRLSEALQTGGWKTFDEILGEVLEEKRQQGIAEGQEVGHD